MEMEFTQIEQWHNWLQNNGTTTDFLWMIFYKKPYSNRTISYEEAVEEALCFGWVDSLIKKLDDQRYKRKFTPRKPNSRWSDTNIRRVKKLISENRIQPEGWAVIGSLEAVQQKRIQPPQVSSEDFFDFISRITKPGALDFFQSLPLSEQKRFVLWVLTAKRAETRQKRFREAEKLLLNHRKLGLK